MSNQIVLLVRIALKPGKKAEFMERLREVEGFMKAEPNFIGATIHDNVENVDEVVVYETWKGTKESWMVEEYPRPYRKPYEAALSNLVENRSVAWLKPIATPAALHP